VAVSWRLVPFARIGFTGVTVMDTSVAGVTVRFAVPDILPEAAVTTVAPVANEEAIPFDPTALLIVATPVFEEYQAARPVRSCVVVSE
jgi:hypothetical protein